MTSADQPATPRIANTVLDLIGHTPLVKLNKVAAGVKPTILAKLEYLNPGGSIKDRIALKMIERAEAEGNLGPGGTVVEPTSGNTGVGLAMVAQQKGYRSVFITPDKVAQEKRDVLKAYGADVVVSLTSVAPDSEDSYYGVANRIESEIEGAYQPNQFFNPAAPESHYESTGPEIWEDTAATVTHFVVGAGTGGTMTGTGRYLKDVSDGAVKVVVADPDGSVYSGGDGRPYFVEGVGEDMWPGNYDPTVVDEVHAVTDAEAFELTRRLASEEGLLVGGSSGMAVAAALKAAENLTEDDVMVVILPDSGRGYMGKVFSDEWMAERGFTVPEHTPAVPERLGTAYLDGTQQETGAQASGPQVSADVAGISTTLREILDDKHSWLPGSLPEVVAVTKDTTVKDAISTMNRYGIDVVAVVGAHRPELRVSEVAGVLSVKNLIGALASGKVAADDTIADVELNTPALAGAQSTVEKIVPLVLGSHAVLVAEAGMVAGVLTCHDVLMHLADAK